MRTVPQAGQLGILLPAIKNDSCGSSHPGSFLGDNFFVDATFWNGTDCIEYVYNWVFDVPEVKGY